MLQSLQRQREPGARPRARRRDHHARRGAPDLPRHERSGSSRRGPRPGRRVPRAQRHHPGAGAPRRGPRGGGGHRDAGHRDPAGPPRPGPGSRDHRGRDPRRARRQRRRSVGASRGGDGRRRPADRSPDAPVPDHAARPRPGASPRDPGGARSREPRVRARGGGRLPGRRVRAPPEGVAPRRRAVGVHAAAAPRRVGAVRARSWRGPSADSRPSRRPRSCSWSTGPTASRRTATTRSARCPGGRASGWRRGCRSTGSRARAASGA